MKVLEEANAIRIDPAQFAAVVAAIDCSQLDCDDARADCLMAIVASLRSSGTKRDLAVTSLAFGWRILALSRFLEGGGDLVDAMSEPGIIACATSQPLVERSQHVGFDEAQFMSRLAAVR